MLRLIRLAAVAALAALLSAGCAGHTAPSPMPQSERQDPNVQPDDTMRMISCFRSHGLPDYPDPVYDRADGRWHTADNAPALSAQIRQACASVMPQSTPASPIPTAQLKDLLTTPAPM
jgi:hypothetical protein